MAGEETKKGTKIAGSGRVYHGIHFSVFLLLDMIHVPWTGTGIRWQEPALPHLSGLCPANWKIEKKQFLKWPSLWRLLPGRRNLIGEK